MYRGALSLLSERPILSPSRVVAQTKTVQQQTRFLQFVRSVLQSGNTVPRADEIVREGIELGDVCEETGSFLTHEVRNEEEDDEWSKRQTQFYAALSELGDAVTLLMEEIRRPGTDGGERKGEQE